MTPSADTPLPADAGRWSALEAVLVRVNRWLIVGLMASMVVLVFANVIARYVLGRSMIWVEEFTQYEMIWVTYLGAGLALREGRHVAVDTFQDLLPERWRTHLRTLIACALAVFLAVLCVLGVQIALFTWDQETPVMNVPAGLPYLAVPVGAAACLLHLVVFWRSFVERRFEQPEDLALKGGE
jgi:TRAP-type C4-dicarboxylate transport system permease small subunit